MKYKEFQAEWRKEISKIKRRMRDLGKRGYKFDFELPEMPKGVAPKQLEDLKTQYTTRKLYTKSVFYPSKTSKIPISGIEGHRYEKRQTKRKKDLNKERKRYEEWKEEYRQEKYDRPEFTSELLTNLREFLRKWANETPLSRNVNWRRLFEDKVHQANALLTLLDDCISREGEKRVALRLETNSLELNAMMVQFEYASNSSQLNDATVRIATIIKGSSLTKQESEYYTEISEQIKQYTEVF